MGLRSRQVWAVVLLMLGVAGWAWTERRAAEMHGHGEGPVRWALIIAAAGLALVPPVRRGVNAVSDHIRNPSPRALEWTTFSVSVLSACYFVFTAFNQDRDLFPKTHDEGSYIIGMRILALGRLWMERHPLADFFDSFYVITEPVYTSMYFPGTALLYVPTGWLDLPTWVLPVAAAGAVVGLVYRVVSELVDGAAGALAALLVVSLSWYRMLSTLVYSQVPLLLMALLMVWAWLKWRRSGPAGWGWALAVGAFAGWAAIIRPLDALSYAVPVGVAMLYDLRARPIPWRLFHPALVVAGAAPFLSLQLYFNHGVTGRLTKTPHTFYMERDQPQTLFGFHAYDAAVVPKSAVRQKRDYYEQYLSRYVREHQPGTFLRTWAHSSVPMLFDATLPARVLIVLVPAGLLGLTTLPRAVLWATLPLFLAGYALHTFFLEHYAAAVIPAVLLSVLLGARALADAWPRWREQVSAGGALLLVTVCVTSLYELNPLATLLDRDAAARRRHEIDDETFRSPTLRFVRAAEDRVQKPAVILFRYAPGANLVEEPVYNMDVAWPDDAPVVRAHDLGERNREIFEYYAQRQPDRMFYRFDRATGTLTPLGPATALAATPPAGSSN